MKEIRNYKAEDAELRYIEEDGKQYLMGYAARYGKKSKLLSERGKPFYEIIQRGAFTEVLSRQEDVIANINHDRTKVMARTKSGTLSLSEDDNGLIYRFEVPNVSYAKDVYELVKRQDLYESSFAFAVTENDQVFSKDIDGTNLRTLTRIERLFDISIVTNGAYETTDVVAREIEDNLTEEEKKIELEKDEKALEQKLKDEDIYKKKRKFDMDYITVLRIKAK